MQNNKNGCQFRTHGFQKCFGRTFAAHHGRDILEFCGGAHDNCPFIAQAGARDMKPESPLVKLQIRFI